MMIKEIIHKLKNNSFISHSKNYLISDFFNKGIAFITIPIFTRLLLPEEYGILAIFSSIIAIFSILIGLNFQGAIARRYYEHGSDFNDFLGSNLIFLLWFNLISIIMLFIFKKNISSFFIIDSNLFFIAIIISSLSFFIAIELSILQASQKSKQYATISVIKSVSITVTAIIWVYLLKNNRYLGKIYAQLIITGIIFVFIILHLFKSSKFKFDIAHLKYSLSFGVPLIPHALSGFILSQFDRIIINQISGSYETGIYSFAYNVGMIMNVVVMAMNKSFVPIFFNKLLNDKYEEIKKLFENYAKIIFIFAFGLILFSKEIIYIMADKKYYSALNIVPLIVLGYVAVFLYTLFANYAFYRKKTGLISLFTFIAGGTNIGLNYIFIPKYGYVAAAWTTLFSYILLFVLHYFNTVIILKEKSVKIKVILIDLGVMVFFLIVYYKIGFSNYEVQLLFKISIFLFLLILYFNNFFLKILKKKPM